MYTVCTLMLFLSLAVIFFTIVMFLLNSWQKKYDKERANYEKKFTKLMLAILFIGISGLIVSGTILLFKIY